MDLIVTHANADFDGLGSLVAAKKLYPASRLLIPGSAEKTVREFLAIFKDTVKIESERDCRLDDVDRLILVDTRHRSRIGIAAKLLDGKKKPKVVIYDHHPRSEHDIKADKDFYEPYGATITMLLKLIRKKNIKLNPIEATILLLGIYEETGSLTFRTTTKFDVDAVSYLLSKDAKLGMVSSYLTKELSQNALEFLVKLINATQLHNINGARVAIAAMETSEYLGELGTLIHKLIDIENVKILFCFVKTGSKVHIIARSHMPDLDVNKIMKRFGGGGHHAASSAKVANGNIDELKEKLFKMLKKEIKVRVYAKDIMSKPCTVSIDTTIKDAQKILLKNKSDALAVVSNKKFVGIITTRNIRKAIQRKYSHARVKGYMITKLDTIKPTTPIYSIQSLMTKKDAGYIPVLKKKKLVGMVTRQDMLKALYRGLFIKRPRAIEISNVRDRIETLLPMKIIKILKLIGKLAQEKSFNAFVVGGFARDLLSGVKNYDVDIVIEGDAIKFGKLLRGKTGGALVVHQKFGTCTLVLPWGTGGISRFKVDIATARKETYKHPAALPDVQFSLLKDDLYRRDFTINAMAVALNKNSFGQLIDFFNGQKDLNSKIIRSLHKKSFIDDPTRIFRAVRFEQRFNFKIEPHTQHLIKTAVSADMFGRTEKQRIRDELILILKEENPLKAVRRMHQLHELRFIHPNLKMTDETQRLFKSVKKLCAWYKKTSLAKQVLEEWLICLIALIDSLSFSNAKDLCEKFVFKRNERQRILQAKRNCRKIVNILEKKSKIPPSLIYKKLKPLSCEAIIYIAAKTKTKRAESRIRNFILEYNKIKIHLRGQDLKNLGLKPGPQFKKILDKVLYAKIDGKIKTKKNELEEAKKWV